jgi:hypothetical protein
LAVNLQLGEHTSLASTLLFCLAAKSYKHGEPLVGGRITTRLPSLTSEKYRAAHVLSSLRSAFLRTVIAVTIAAGSKLIGHQCRKYLSVERLATRRAAEFGKVEISESKRESFGEKYLRRCKLTVSFGRKRTRRAEFAMSALPPESRHRSTRCQCPLCAKSRHSVANQRRRLCASRRGGKCTPVCAVRGVAVAAT